MSSTKHRVKHEFHLGKLKTESLELLASAMKKHTSSLVCKIVKSVCDHKFYHWQVSHDDELMARLTTVCETHKIARSELVRYAVIDMVRKLELEQSDHDFLWSRDSERD